MENGNNLHASCAVLPSAYGITPAPSMHGAFEQAADTWEYLLVAQPGKNICSRLMAEQAYFSHTYRPETHPPQPHIVIACFYAKEAMEETLLKWMHRICSMQQGFTTALNNYSGFPPHTVYVRVQNPLPFHLLAKELRVIDQYLQGNGFPAMQQVNRLHLGIARELDERLYDKAMLDYSGKTFYDTFPVHELLLLKREHKYAVPKTVNVFGLQPMQENDAA